MNTPVRYCSDCKWCRPPRNLFRLDYEFAKCAHPGARPINLVSPTQAGSYCSTQRSYHIETCGPEGTWWEPKA